MPEIPQIDASGAIQAPGPVQVSKSSPALGALDETGQQVVALSAHFATIRRDTQGYLAGLDYENRIDEEMQGPNGVLNDPKYRSDPMAARDQVMLRSQGILSDIRKRYPFMSPEATAELGKRSDTKARIAFRLAHSNAEQDTKDEAQVAGAQALMAAVNTSDPGAQRKAGTDYMSLIDSYQAKGLWTAGQAELEKHNFWTGLGKALFQKDATANPGHIMMMTEPPAGITPEQFQQTKQLAIDATENNYRNLEAGAKADAANNATAILQLAAQGKPYSAQLEAAAAKKALPPDFYQQMTGHPFQQTMPGVREAFDNAVKMATSPEDLDQITEHAAVAQEAGQMSSKDYAIVSLTAAHQKAELKTAGKADAATAKAELMDNLFPPRSRLDGMSDPMAAKLSRENVNEYFEARLLAHKGDAEAARKDTEQHYRDFLKTPGSAGAFMRKTEGSTGPSPGAGATAAVPVASPAAAATMPYTRNAPFATSGPYNTELASGDETSFRDWLTKNKVPFDPNEKNPDYDMRGYWRDVVSKGGDETDINPVDHKLHFPDSYKTPYHESFSAESKYATANNPFKWKGEKLIDTRTGKVVYETRRGDAR